MGVPETLLAAFAATLLRSGGRVELEEHELAEGWFVAGELVFKEGDGGEGLVVRFRDGEGETSREGVLSGTSESPLLA